MGAPAVMKRVSQILLLLILNEKLAEPFSYGSLSTQRASNHAERVIDIRIFVDESMQKLFKRANIVSYERFFMALMNSVEYLYNGPSLEISKLHKFRFVVSGIHKISEHDLPRPSDPDSDLGNGDREYFREIFNNFQNSFRAKSTTKWDMSMLFSSLAREEFYDMLNGPELLKDRIEDYLSLREKSIEGVSSLPEIPQGHMGHIMIHTTFGYISNTVAHEIAHSLSINHDSLYFTSRKFLMEPGADYGVQGYKWSSQSNSKFNDIDPYLEESYSKPLPPKSFEARLRHLLLNVNDKKLFGEVYDADRQCSLLFGDTWTAEEHSERHNMCTRLACQRVINETVYRIPYSHLYGAEHGTKCGLNKQCHQGECITVTKP